MKKILFLSPLPPPHYGSALSSEMCLNILGDSKEFNVRNIKLNYSRNMSDIGKINLGKIVGIFEVKKEIRREIKLFRPDFVYFVPATSGLGLMRDCTFSNEIKRHIGKGKIIFHIRSRITDEDWMKKRYRKMYRKMFSGEHAIVLDERLKKDLHKLIPNEKIFVIPNAIRNEISDKKFREMTKEDRKSDEFNILFLSNMDKTKGWAKLLQACKILNEKNVDFKCSFVGAFSGRKEKCKFNSYVKKNNLQNRISYLGKRIGDEKNKILENSSVLVFPTEYKLETFGRVIIEAMMFGLPVIANGIASIPTIIQDDKTGFVLRNNSPIEIAEKIRELRKNKKLRLRMGKIGRKRFLDHYEIKNYQRKFIQVMKKI